MKTPSFFLLVNFLLLVLSLVTFEACTPPDAAPKKVVSAFLKAAQTHNEQQIFALMPSLKTYPPAQRQAFVANVGTISNWSWLGISQNGMTFMAKIQFRDSRGITQTLGIPVIQTPHGWIIGDKFQLVETIPRIELKTKP